MYRLCSVSYFICNPAFCAVLFAKTTLHVFLFDISFLWHGLKYQHAVTNTFSEFNSMSHLNCYLLPSHHPRTNSFGRPCQSFIPFVRLSCFHGTNHPLPLTAVDLTALYPPSVTLSILTTLRSYYHTTYKDQFFSPGGPPTAWFSVFLWMEALYHVPLSLWAVGALWDGKIIFFSILPRLLKVGEMMRMADADGLCM